MASADKRSQSWLAWRNCVRTASTLPLPAQYCCSWCCNCWAAALAWAEALTLVHRSHAPDTDYEAVRAQFNEAETVELTLAIAAINAWNRLCIAFRSQPALA